MTTEHRRLRPVLAFSVSPKSRKATDRPIVPLGPFSCGSNDAQEAMHKTDLSPIISALGLAVALGTGLTACALLATFIAGLLIGQTTRRGP